VAASQRGKFWEMRGIYFITEETWAASIARYAIEAGVKDKNFIPNLMDSVYGWTVRADLLDGLELGVRDVPAIFINNERFTGRLDYLHLSKVVDMALSRPKKRRA
jgi:protein-disulfide isomerase